MTKLGTQHGYADDIAAMDDTAEGLQETTDHIAKHCRCVGLQINSGKTKAMVIEKDTSQHPIPKNRKMNLNVDGNPVKQVTHSMVPSSEK